MSYPVLTFFQSNADILVVGSSEDADGAVCEDAGDVILLADATEVALVSAVEGTLSRSRGRVDNRPAAARSDEAESAIAGKLGFNDWRDVLASTRRAALYEYANAEFDVAPLGFVDGDDVMLSQKVVSFQSPSLQELSASVLAALQQSEIR